MLIVFTRRLETINSLVARTFFNKTSRSVAAAVTIIVSEVRSTSVMDNDIKCHWKMSARNNDNVFIGIV